MAFHVAVMSEIRHHDKAQILGERFESIERVNLAAKLQTFLGPFLPMALVVVADDMEQFLAAQPF